MKKPVLFLLLLMLTFTAAGPGLAQPTGPVPVPADQFNLEQYRGKVVFLDFWASWCKPCRQSLPWLNSMQQRYGEGGLQVVTVNLDKDPEAAADMAAGIDAAILQYLDPEGEMAARLELEGMPSSFLYDRSGELVDRHVGFLKADGPQREKAVLAVLESGQE